jgi:predicted anti-sigma-YlaC factor YlaD
LAALAPDRTLSETEERLLARHLERCPSCSEFAASVAAFTSELREAPLVAPETSGSRSFRGVHKRRRRSVRLPLVALTAAAASVVMTSVVLDSKSGHVDLPNSPGALVVYAGEKDDSAMLRNLRDISNARQVEPEVSPKGQPGFIAG